MSLNIKKFDVDLFEAITSISNQATILAALNKVLKKKYSKVVLTKNYLFAEGNIPIGLVAHADTVFDADKEDKEIFYDSSKQVSWSPQGLGADDRAGIFAILKILQTELRPSIFITTDEESGGLGSYALIEDYPNCPVADLRYLIQLDRQGEKDCVFYDCINKDFIKYIESFGFVRAKGLFSDISILCPFWKVAGVNLSVGYEDEHTYVEILRWKNLFKTIHKVTKMLSEETIPNFKYIEKNLHKTNFFPENGLTQCENCGKLLEEWEAIPIKRDSKEKVYYCSDCCVNHVNWCDVCGMPYEKNTKHNCSKIKRMVMG